MKNYFIIGNAKIRPNGEWGDEYTSYMGFDKAQAYEFWQEQKHLYNNDKYTEVFGKVFEIDDDIDETNIDEILEYIQEECVGWNPLEDFVGGFLVREARLRNGLTQVQVSNLIGMPLRTLEQWETDKRVPSLWVANLVIEKIEKN